MPAPEFGSPCQRVCDGSTWANHPSRNCSPGACWRPLAVSHLPFMHQGQEKSTYS
jgi:hypothetical protein